MAAPKKNHYPHHMLTENLPDFENFVDFLTIFWCLQHSGHVFKPLDGIYEEHKKKISDELNQLKSRHAELICLVQDVVRLEGRKKNKIKN